MVGGWRRQVSFAFASRFVVDDRRTWKRLLFQRYLERGEGEEEGR